MEDTLVELKASCAGVLAGKTMVDRRLAEARSRADLWNDRAKLAVDKGRDDLAREALNEKRRFQKMIESFEEEMQEHGQIVAQYQEDIQQLEDKLHKAREKQRLLVQRHIRARRKKRAQEDIRRLDNYEAIARFDEFESRIDRMEAEADLVNHGRRDSLDERFDKLMVDEEIETELAALKASKMEKEQGPKA
jgi:phage shock protein A